MCRLLLTLVVSQAIACAENPGIDETADESDENHERSLAIDEPKIDVGSALADPADGPVGVHGGPVFLPVGLSWTDLEGTHAADVSGGTVALAITNLTKDTITAAIVVVRSSGAARATQAHSTIIVDAGATTPLVIELLPAAVDLGDVETSLNLRVDATVVVGDGVEVTDDVALGHYQSSTMYFHAIADGGHSVYGEDALRDRFNDGLIDAATVAPGNEIKVPDGATLEGVLVGAEG